MQKITAAVTALASTGFEMDTLGILVNGQSTQASVTNNFNALKAVALRGDGSLASRAALNLCYGFPFSGCPGINPSDPGPFMKDANDDMGATCIQNAALELGYGPKGAMIQLDQIKNNFQNWNQFQNWGELLTALMGYKQSADSSSTPFADRKTYLNNVYGIQLQDPQYGCNINGVSMYRYYYTSSINPTTFIFGGSKQDQPQTHFLGRYNWKNGFPQVLVSSGPQTPAGNYTHEAQVFVTQIQIPVDGTYQFVLASNFQARVEYGSNPAIDTTINTPTIVGGGTYTEGMRIPLRIVFYGLLSNWGFNFLYSYNGSALTAIPPQLLLLPKSTKNPMFEIAVSDGTDPTGTIPKGTIGETTGLVSNIYANGLTVGTVGGKQAMVVSGGISCALNTLTYSQGIRGRAFRSITTMVYVSSVTGTGTGTPGIFMMYNLPSSAGYLPTLDPCGNYVIQDAGSPTPRKGTPQESWDYNSRTQDMGLYLVNGGTQIMFGCKGWSGATNLAPISIKLNTWHHIALIWDDDWNGIQIWLDGANTQPNGSIPCIGPRGPMIFEQFRVGCDETAPVGWTGGMRWFRGFDYRLTPFNIVTDNNNQWDINSA